MGNVSDHRAIATILLASLFFSALLSPAQEKKEFSCELGPGAIIAITNNCGSITVKPSTGMRVSITSSHSDAFGFIPERHGNRLNLRSVPRCHEAASAVSNK